MRLLADGIRPRDIVTKQALENAATIVAATGGSTNAALHLPAIAHEAGIKFDLFDVAKIFKQTPYIADLKPGGKYVAKDVFDIGGVPQIMKALLDGGYFHEDCITVTGRTLKQNLEKVKFNTNQKVVYPTSNPLSKTGGVVGLKGSLAPDGAIVKIAGMKTLKFSGPARCFDSEEACFAAVQAKKYKEGEVLVIRYEGPRRRPRHARDALDDGGPLRPGRRREGGAHHRWALLRRHARLLHRPCRARGGVGRSDRPHQERRHHHYRCRQGHARSSPFEGGAGEAPQGLEAQENRLPERCALEVRPTGWTRANRRGHPSGCQGRNPIAMRTYEKLARAFVLLLALALSRPALAEDAYTSAAKAYQAGVAAIETRNFDEAFKALEFAADAGSLLRQIRARPALRERRAALRR